MTCVVYINTHFTHSFPTSPLCLTSNACQLYACCQNSTQIQMPISSRSFVRAARRHVAATSHCPCLHVLCFIHAHFPSLVCMPVFHLLPLSTSCSHACVSFTPAFRLLFACLCFIHARFPPLVRMPVFHSCPLSASCSHACVSFTPAFHLLFACLCFIHARFPPLFP
jgi:hypothetical protein